MSLMIHLLINYRQSDIINPAYMINTALFKLSEEKSEVLIMRVLIFINSLIMLINSFFGINCMPKGYAVNAQKAEAAITASSEKRIQDGTLTGAHAIVVQNGKMTDEIDLSAVNGSYELIINGGKLLVEKNQISYMESDCPDHICVRTGILKNAGDTAACVPNKTCVYIKGTKNIDASTY